jgi:hypothetical protein
MADVTSQRGARRRRSQDAEPVIAERPEEAPSIVHPARRPAWWVHPTWVLIAITLPVLLLTLLEGPAGLVELKNYVDNYTPYNCFLAVASLFALVGGTCVFAGFGSPTNSAVSSIDPIGATLVLRWLGGVSLAAYLLFVGPLLLHPDVVWQVLQGSGAEEAKQSMSRMPGITSFTNIAPLFCAVMSAARLNPRFRLTADLKSIFVGLAIFTFARAIIGSERLALIEFIAPLVLAQAAFQSRQSFFRATFPIFGLIAIVIYFAAGEYLRSWQYYQFSGGGQFWDFATTRFVGYYSTALNNGMGMFQVYSPLGVPRFTLPALGKLPMGLSWGGEADSVTSSGDILLLYLYEYGSWEFNNFSGLFAPLIDFGVAIGLATMCVVGIIVGMLYRSYAQRRLAGLILYPTCYIGTLEIVRLFYFGEPRVVPIYLVAGMVGWALRSRRPQAGGMVERHRVAWDIGSRKRVA